MEIKITCCSCNVVTTDRTFKLTNYFCLKNMFYSFEEAIKQMRPDLKIPDSSNLLQICCKCKDQIIKTYKKFLTESASDNNQIRVQLPDHMNFAHYKKLIGKKVYKLQDDVRVCNSMYGNIVESIGLENWTKMKKCFFKSENNTKERESVD